MSSVTFSTTVGGDGSTVTDDSNASTGLDNGGHRARFVPALAQVVQVAGFVVSKVTEAAASATNAASSATAAGTSATNAASSATAAGTSATNAANSATTAAGTVTTVAASATAAGVSATAAANSATAAGTSATNAANSETAAASSASTATTQASNASTSATNASNSATAASGSASTASTQASNASTSATNAANSATAAGTSATNAANSATAAGTSATNASNSATAAAASAAAASATALGDFIGIGATQISTNEMLGTAAFVDVGDITATTLGLGNVDNTSDAGKPVSTAQATAIGLKQDTLVSGTNLKTINTASLLGSTDIALQTPIGTISGIAKGNGANALTAATAGTDYEAPGTASTATADRTFQANITETPVVANTSTAYTVTERTMHDLTLTGNCTFTFPSLAAGKQFTLILKQDGTGSRTITWPSTVRWGGGTAPTITATAAKTDVIGFVCDGTYWMGFVGGQNFTRA